MPVGTAPSRPERVTWQGHHDTRTSECVETFDDLARRTASGVDAAMFVWHALVALL